MAPDVAFEHALREQGYTTIAGIDEAGRGCWAGPVVAAAVVLSPYILAQPDLMPGINDSKTLTPAQRDVAFACVYHHAASVGIGIVPAYLIDTYGILPATHMAMTVALLSLPCLPDALLIDAVTLKTLSLHQQALIRGDSRSLSIAAASIIAKVTRDRLMRTADQAFPGYSFAQHKGYGTALHRKALQTLGPCPLHRLTFRPVEAIHLNRA